MNTACTKGPASLHPGPASLHPAPAPSLLSAVLAHLEPGAHLTPPAPQASEDVPQVVLSPRQGPKCPRGKWRGPAHSPVPLSCSSSPSSDTPRPSPALSYPSRVRAHSLLVPGNLTVSPANRPPGWSRLRVPGELQGEDQADAVRPEELWEWLSGPSLAFALHLGCHAERVPSRREGKGGRNARTYLCHLLCWASHTLPLLVICVICSL